MGDEEGEISIHEEIEQKTPGALIRFSGGYEDIRATRNVLK